MLLFGPSDADAALDCASSDQLPDHAPEDDSALSALVVTAGESFALAGGSGGLAQRLTTGRV
jgi:hypothetical protein